ncbi:hypothetical protein MUK42_03221 [Musa troglodytarum]|uniref:SAM domain-containing protein n=1 Tax=Musa troglodytarum TaxID=320322 RepID=A0A9E7HYK8_9LILI|nr:hypothetical protein MUK42_03221 [Musa troglodytarum]
MSARPHVTITLGRSGQFVKRARPGADFGQSDHDVSSGRHQPTRERSGSDMTDSSLYGSQHKNKRIRTENNNSSSDRRIGRNDLRFKLINKSLFRKTDTGGGGQNDVDLREKLSRNREISFKSNPRRNLGEFRTSGTVRRLPPMRSADDLLQLDSKRKSYSSRTVDERRHRSPDKLNSNARAFYSPRSHKDLPHALSMRPIDASRHSSFIKNGLVNSSRTISSLGKTGLPIDAGKSVVRDSSSGSIMHRSTHKPEEPFTVSGFLNALGLGKYAILFQAEEIDMTSLREMGDHDLKELGIPMGPRKKILLALLSHTKYQYL